MALQGVRQENYSGCFIAAIATLMGKTYHDIFSVFYPGSDELDVYDHGFKEISVEHAAFSALERVGIKAHRSSFKKFRSYAKRDRHALLIVRWVFAPTLCHTIVYDGEAHKFIDPTFGHTIGNDKTIRRLQEQLDFGIWIDEIPKEQHESQRYLGDGLQLPQS